MAKYLTCPEIARRIGYSRMQVARWAKENRIPGTRIVTAGGHYRYKLDPLLTKWIRLRRRQGREPWMGFSGALEVKHPAKRVISGQQICREIDELLDEIGHRVLEIALPNPIPTQAELKALDDRLVHSIKWLTKGREMIRPFL